MNERRMFLTESEVLKLGIPGSEYNGEVVKGLYIDITNNSTSGTFKICKQDGSSFKNDLGYPTYSDNGGYYWISIPDTMLSLSTISSDTGYKLIPFSLSGSTLQDCTHRINKTGLIFNGTFASGSSNYGESIKSTDGTYDAGFGIIPGLSLCRKSVTQSGSNYITNYMFKGYYDWLTLQNDPLYYYIPISEINFGNYGTNFNFDKSTGSGSWNFYFYIKFIGKPTGVYYIPVE